VLMNMGRLLQLALRCRTPEVWVQAAKSWRWDGRALVIVGITCGVDTYKVGRALVIQALLPKLRQCYLLSEALLSSPTSPAHTMLGWGCRVYAFACLFWLWRCSVRILHSTYKAHTMGMVFK
jgi:hypothetical protein